MRAKRYSPSKSFNRQGLPNLYGRHMNILLTLLEEKARGNTWVALKLPKRTHHTLVSNDLIFGIPSVLGNGTDYMITGRGEQVLKEYQTLKRRNDGLCPMCGVVPRAVSTSGRDIGYCRDCARKHANSQYHKHGRQANWDAPCSRCHAAPRYVSPKGFRRIYCESCYRENRKEERERRRVRSLEKLEKGERLSCRHCGIRQRHIAGKSVYDYCYLCLTRYMKKYRRNRIYRAVMSRHIHVQGEKES